MGETSNSAYSSGQYFSTTISDKYYVKVTPSYPSSYLGGYAVGVNTSATWRPGEFAAVVASATPLTSDRWEDGTISTSYEVDWYKFTATAGTPYYIWWNDEYSGDWTKDLDVDVYAYRVSDGGEIYFYNHDDAWSSYQTINLTADDTILLRVRSLYGNPYTGTYGIVFSTSDTRPAL
ncbi:hypothetical protein FACS1894163_13570 [Spirochaetia bacterium]|nr:hypothetical protein FACS1894163_13570 [Spirochaetia bacterium]